MKVRNLSNLCFSNIIDCFLLAFEHYFVQMPSDSNYYKERWKAAKVNFEYSYGMFDHDQLVGFIIHAIDKRSGYLTAYNTGTGVIPEYRGKGIVNSIYKYALQDLIHNGFEKSKLEVITKNEVAIRTYKKIGFEIGKEYKCFAGEISILNPVPYELKQIIPDEFDWENLPNQELYSWDNQKESLLAGNYRYYQVFHQGKAESFFIIKPDSGYLAQFDLLVNEKDAWLRLFSAIGQISPFIKINNVDAKLTDKINILHDIGLENKIDQYEMELKLDAIEIRSL